MPPRIVLGSPMKKAVNGKTFPVGLGPPRSLNGLLVSHLCVLTGTVEDGTLTLNQVARPLRFESGVLVRKGVVSNDEVLEEAKAVRRELEAKRAR